MMERQASNFQLPASLARIAQQYLVGGVNSPVRAFRAVGVPPLMLVQGRGPRVVTSRGERLIDFIMGWGALILGHNHPAVIRALRAQVRDSTLLGLTHPAEGELARLVSQAIPSVEQVRLTVSGTEACMTAVKLARAHTGRPTILMCDGGYHGHSDSLMANRSAGIPSALAAQTLSVPYNDADALASVVRRHGDTIAAVIIEPVAANMGVVLPQPGYLARVRELTKRHGILLIFDEVVTGFRVGPSGAQGLCGLMPDLTTFGKIIGGGLPIGALGGPRRLMERLAPLGDVYHAGTFAGHPLSMQAGVATLQHLAAQPPYKRLERLGACLETELCQEASRAGVPIQINRAGSMFTVFFADAPVQNGAQAAASQRGRFAQWANSLRRSGVLVPPSPLEALFLSTAHTERHVDQLLTAARKAFASIGGGRPPIARTSDRVASAVAVGQFASPLRRPSRPPPP